MFTRQTRQRYIDLFAEDEPPEIDPWVMWIINKVVRRWQFRSTLLAIRSLEEVA